MSTQFVVLVLDLFRLLALFVVGTVFVLGPAPHQVTPRAVFGLLFLSVSVVLLLENQTKTPTNPNFKPN